MISALDTFTSSYQGFDPAVHLAPIHEKPGVLKAEELGYPPTADSDVVATKPFPLFTPEAVRRIRTEMFDHETLANHLYSDDNTPCVIRGACPQRAPFTFAAWTHPAVVARLNDLAGVSITPVFDYEIGHVNLQLGPRGWAGLKAEPDVPDSVGILGSQTEIQPTLMLTPNWHKDSYPFVCILMLSETSHIQGGRTIIRKADGSNYYCDMPPIGCGMILRGGNTIHAVSPTDTTQERISMITSFRPTDPLVKDECVLKTVRMSSEISMLHKQWCQYRLRLLSKRAEALALQMENNVGRSVEEQMIEFVKEQGGFLSHTIGEMINPVARVRTNVRQSFLDWKDNQDMVLAHL